MTRIALGKELPHAYPLELFLRVITVSLEKMKIVDGLPKLELAG
jgi:hypothetical protein